MILAFEVMLFVMIGINLDAYVYWKKTNNASEQTRQIIKQHLTTSLGKFVSSELPPLSVYCNTLYGKNNEY